MGIVGALVVGLAMMGAVAFCVGCGYVAGFVRGWKLRAEVTPDEPKVDVEAITSLQLQRGDVLFFTSQREMTEAACERLTQTWRDICKDGPLEGVKAVVLQDGVRVAATAGAAPGTKH